MSEMSFETLVNQARSGDQTAIGALLERYRNYLLFIANHDVDKHLQAKMGASDAVQESILHAQANFNRFQGDSEFEWKSWLKAILANDIRKGNRQFRTHKRDANREINIQEQSAVGRGLVDNQLTPSSEAIAREKSKALAAAMDELSEIQRHVIQLRNFERRTFADIGEQIQRSEDASRKLWARSIEALKNSMKSLTPELMPEFRIEGQNHE